MMNWGREYSLGIDWLKKGMRDIADLVSKDLGPNLSALQ